MNKRDRKHLDLAFKLAQAAEKVAGARLGALLVIGNRVVAMGHNQYRTHPLQKRWGKNSDAIYLHAEIAAIVNFLRSNSESDLQNATLYVARVLANSDTEGMAKPCPGCAAAIDSYGIKRVVYTK